ncbi:MAG: hypothetical protein A2031_02795 [Deltaproteobacteria bacterium RBG_19FT_COMBO_43_11]|nr:MAG: hypothetical protein A2031_02795 [Deltaproteobacteria bacterium RBG_19FT_COMBO_43_11]
MSAGNTDSAFYKKLKKEVERWQTEGIIVSGQKERILERYKRAEEIEEKAGSNKLITTISVLGAILVGVGFILFIASNWSEIPRAGKLGIIFGAMLVSYILGFYLRYERKNYPKIGVSLILLGTIIFGAGIFLIAQIYNITVHYPNGSLMWGLAILPLAYLLRFQSVLTLALLVLCIWLGMELTFHIADDYSYIKMVVVFFMSGVMLWWVGYAHKGLASLRNISAPYILLGIIITFGSAFILTFNVNIEKFGSLNLIPFYFPIIVLFVVAAIVYAATGEKEKGWQIELTVLALMLSGFFVLAVFYPDTAAYKEQSFNRIIFNIIYAAGIIGIIYLGYLNKNPAYINIGLLFFVLDVIARYFDFFWKLLPRSLFFIGGGLILLAGSVILERKRRVVLQSFEAKEEIL